ncbi:unnamed protein product, partial [Ectocarpus sp. 13 AM-2016]
YYIVVWTETARVSRSSRTRGEKHVHEIEQRRVLAGRKNTATEGRGPGDSLTT